LKPRQGRFFGAGLVFLPEMLRAAGESPLRPMWEMLGGLRRRGGIIEMGL